MNHFCYHTIIVSKDSGKIRHYFGKHSTKNLNDKYVGSGRIIKDILKSKKEFEITCTRSGFFETSKDALEFEVLLIAEGRDKYGDSVINMTNGGEGVGGYQHSDLVKAKMSKALKGKIRSEEIRLNMSIGQTGKKHSEETKAKMSVSRKGANNPGFKGWYNTPAGKFTTSFEAAEHNGCSDGSIRNWCKAGKNGYSFVPKQCTPPVG